MVLALLGAPMAMHVVMHDLHHHHDTHAATFGPERGHGDHEHPIVSSPAPDAPRPARAAVAVTVAPAAMPAMWMRMATGDRNVLSSGALRMDHDVGLQPLLSTFLI